MLTVHISQPKNMAQVENKPREPSNVFVKKFLEGPLFYAALTLECFVETQDVAAVVTIWHILSVHWVSSDGIFIGRMG